MRSRLLDSLARLPVIRRCVVIGWVSTGTLAAVITVINVIREYPLDGVVQAALFGIIEAFVLAGFVGGCIGFLVGLVARLDAREKQRR
jgi:hypothetical protein